VAIRYARRGDAHLSYDTIGDGPIDILHFVGFILPIDALDEEPHVARYYRRLASFGRVIHFDPRGIGQSDPYEADAARTVVAAAEDAVAVLDAVGSEHAAVVAWGASCPIAIELAAGAGDRIDALVLGNPYARLPATEGYPEGVAPDLVEGFLRDNPDPDTQWSLEGDDDLDLFAPSMARDVRFREWIQRASRRAASPANARAYLALTVGADVRDRLAAIRARTLVLHSQQNRFVPRRLGRYVASGIEGAQFVLAPGADHVPWTASSDAVLDEVEEFLTGHRHGSADRVLTTVLFTDLVDSTRHAAELGDAAWRRELDAHDAIVRSQLGRFGGREVNTTGDGFVATFDAPTSAVRAAIAIIEAARAAGFAVRAGIHTGECERRGDDLAGLAVHIAARVGAEAGAGEVLVSRTVSDIVSGSGLALESRGEFELKGVPQRWELFAVQP
jgi:class 3 adenylate cyclase